MARLRYENILIDLAGVLYDGDAAIPGAADALARLRAAGCGICFVTNTTRRTRAVLVERLTALGFDIAAGEVLTAARAAQALVAREGLTPHLLIHPDLAPEFGGSPAGEPDAVVVGDAGDAFTYTNLNRAFRVLMASDSPRLIAMGDNRYFAEGETLSLDMGPFVHALAYAAGIEPEVVGKPAAPFFEAALHQIGAEPGDAVMIGDDIAGDVGGAQDAGLAGILVRTGKYRPRDERDPGIRPTHVADDFAAAVDWILGGQAARGAGH